MLTPLKVTCPDLPFAVCGLAPAATTTGAVFIPPERVESPVTANVLPRGVAPVTPRVVPIVAAPVTASVAKLPEPVLADHLPAPVVSYITGAAGLVLSCHLVPGL